MRKCFLLWLVFTLQCNDSDSRCYVNLATDRSGTIRTNQRLAVSWSSSCQPDKQDNIRLYFGAPTSNSQKWWTGWTQGALQDTLSLTVPGAAGVFNLAYYRGTDPYPASTQPIEIASASAEPICLSSGKPRSNIEHIVTIVQENHSFDSYFGNYCSAATGSAPSCTLGPACCEAGPKRLGDIKPVVLDDDENMDFDPNHTVACEIAEMDKNKMDRYVYGTTCSNPRSFAYANAASLSTYWNYASKYALADRYFQSAAGASGENNMYLARAAFVFTNNNFLPNAIGRPCNSKRQGIILSDPTIASLLNTCSVAWGFYAEGYAAAKSNPNKCGDYNPLNNPFQYYEGLVDNPLYQKDYTQFTSDLAAGTLPSVVFIKGTDAHDEHPRRGKLSAGQAFVSGIVSAILNSPLYAKNTLILVVPDESGGYYDHVTPPPESTVDFQPYGARIPLLALGYFAKSNTISHVQMEHASIIRFIEWNFLGGKQGQLGNRDATASNLGSLLDPSKTGVVVPN